MPNVSEHSHLHSIICCNSNSDAQIVDRSEGNFLWVVFATRRIINKHYEGKTQRQLEATFREMPQELDNIYDDILQRLPEREKLRSIMLFQWICFAQRPLEIAELRNAKTINYEVCPMAHLMALLSSQIGSVKM